ncbi:hypothetical protein KUL49_26160 [Alteromonas sp. KUL49]|nr:DUF2884 family protein [Alteromonas sp. KUL49]GEA12241.1 hypothetical protein KUL49_26160 [Alteromonas sp. KUL49]
MKFSKAPFKHLCAYIVTTLALIVSAMPAHADFTCDIDFAYGIAVNNSQVRVMEKTRTVIQINEQHQLFIGGTLQTLSEDEQRLLKEYSRGLHYVVPKMIVLATEGVDLAVDTIERVYLGLVGRDHESFERLNSAMKRVRWKVKDKFRHASNHYYIGPGTLESVDEFVDTEIEAQLEEAISTSIGGILSAIGGINTEEGEVSEARVEEIARQLEMMGEQLELEVGPKADTLRNKAQWFCNKLKRLDRIEEKLRASVTALQPYDIITSQPQHNTQSGD